jgi:hypothetical protein
MPSKLIATAGLLTFLSACMSTAPQLGPDASAWDNYLSWYKASPEPMTGDPTGFLKNVHDGANAYRNVYVNSIGEAVNKGGQGLPYPAGTILATQA